MNDATRVVLKQAKSALEECVIVLENSEADDAYFHWEPEKEAAEAIAAIDALLGPDSP